MGVGKKKTRAFKDTQCRTCKLSNKVALRNGQPCCTYPGEVQIRSGQCQQRQEIKQRSKGR